jgi:ATP-dependent DNA helicase DinG
MSIAQKIKRLTSAQPALPVKIVKAKKHVGDINDIFKSLSKKSNTTYREEQVDLSSCICKTLKNNGVSIFESPTGTGKTLAYLAAACQYVKETQDKVVIATTTRHLQLQAMEDFKRLLNPYYPDITLAILKGKTNYISKKRIDIEISLYKDPDNVDLLNKLSDECEKICGDATLLPQNIIDDMGKHDMDINTLLIKEWDRDQDHLHYYYQAKKTANGANIVITNHHSFTSHALFRNFAELPFSEKKVIIDEAHELERNVFNLSKKSIAYTTVKTAVSRLLNLMKDDREKNNNTGKAGVTVKAIESVKEQCNEIDRIIDDLRKDSKIDERNEIFISASGTENSNLHKVAYKSVFALSKAVSNVMSAVKGVKNNRAFLHVIDNLSSYEETLKAICKSIKNELFDEVCFFVKFSDKEKFPSIYSIATSVAGKLTKIWSGYDSIILLSGTLTDEDGMGFSIIKRDLCLGKTIQRIGVTYEKQYEGFDYKDNVTAYLYPNNPLYIYDNEDSNCDNKDVISHYAKDIASCINRIIKASNRGVLILTASHFETTLLEKIVGHNNDVITYTPWGGAALSERIKQFEESKGVLISASAWTGVDIKDTISDLIITRVPNASPDDPIIKAEKLNRSKFFKGFSIFLKSRYKTFIKTRQGMGRLCRKESDSGNIHMLDARVVVDDRYRHYLNYIQKKFTLKKRNW